MPKVASAKTIGTHSGGFHADEALACYLLRQLDEYRDAKIVRTRDAGVLATADIVVDVGGEYDAERLRFDHHQRTFNTTFDDAHSTKLSSAGLVYKHFGRRLLATRYLADGDAGTPADERSAEVTLVFNKLYDDLIESIDGIDNGVRPADGRVAYRMNTHLSARVGRLYPYWHEAQDAAVFDARFADAMAMCGAEFDAMASSVVRAWLPARRHVVDAVRARESVDASGRIVELRVFVPWKEHLASVERELGCPRDDDDERCVLYMLYRSDDSWRVQAVPLAPDSFDSRRPLPEPLRGLRDAELSARAGIDDLVFVHASGFIGGAKTRDAALRLAVAALDKNWPPAKE